MGEKEKFRHVCVRVLLIGKGFRGAKTPRLSCVVSLKCVQPPSGVLFTVSVRVAPFHSDFLFISSSLPFFPTRSPTCMFIS